MRIAIVGGAMGSVYAGLLGAAGNDVWAIDTWHEHVSAIRAGGLRVEGASGDRVVHVHATSNPDEVGAVDLVVPRTRLDGAGSPCRSTIQPRTPAPSVSASRKHGPRRCSTTSPGVRARSTS